MSVSRHCLRQTRSVCAREPTGRANARPMTGSATKQSILSLRGTMDCFDALAMTVSCCDRQNGLLRNFEPFRPYRHGSSTALVMPIRTPATISGLVIRACSAIGGASRARPLYLSVISKRFRQLPRTRAQRSLVGQSTPSPHRRYAVGRFQRADQHRAGGTFLFAHEIDAPVDAVGAIDIGEARRAEHDGISRRRPSEGVCGRLRVMIGLDLDDDAADAVHQHRSPDQVRRDLVHATGEERAFEGFAQSGSRLGEATLSHSNRGQRSKNALGMPIC